LVPEFYATSCMILSPKWIFDSLLIRLHKSRCTYGWVGSMGNMSRRAFQVHCIRKCARHSASVRAGGPKDQTATDRKRQTETDLDVSIFESRQSDYFHVVWGGLAQVFL
jgi:hypothetical protein